MGRAVIESLPVGGQPQYRVRYQRGGFGSHVPDSIMARGGIELGRELKRAEMDAFCASRGDSASSLRIGARGWGAQHGTSSGRGSPGSATQSTLSPFPASFGVASAALGHTPSASVHAAASSGGSSTPAGPWPVALHGAPGGWAASPGSVARPSAWPSSKAASQGRARKRTADDAASDDAQADSDVAPGGGDGWFGASAHPACAAVGGSGPGAFVAGANAPLPQAQASAAWGSPVASTGAQWGGFSTHHGGAAPAGGSAHRSTATADEDDDLF